MKTGWWLLRAVFAVLAVFGPIEAGRTEEVFDPRKPRTFTDTQGRSLVAIVQAMEGDQVTILRKGGQSFTVDKALFSDADQIYFKQWHLDAMGLPQKLDERIQPGKEVTLALPELPKMKDGNETVLKFRVPENFSYPDPVPVFVWMSGGGGSNNYNTQLCPQEDFLLIGLPFAEGTERPSQCMGRGEFDDMHAYQKLLLDKVFEMVPNIDRRLCVMGGFSNGAHTTCSYVVEEPPGYSDFFNTLIVVDGGTRRDDNNARALKGRHVFYAYASEGSHIGFQERSLEFFFSKADKDKLLVHQFPGGHAFPKPVQDMAAEWIKNTVIPDRMSATEE